MKRYLLYRLVLPLIVLFGICILLSLRWPEVGLFVNIASELIGILITILYVDWILKQHELQRWNTTDIRIANRLRILLNTTVSSIRSGLGLSYNVVNELALRSNDLITIHNELMRVAEHAISPVIYQQVCTLDRNGWKLLTTQIANAHNGALAFFNAFQSRLDPQQITRLLDLQEALSSSLIFYTIFPDIAGVPEIELPQTNTPPVLLQQSGCKNTAKEIQKAISLVKEISKSIIEH